MSRCVRCHMVRCECADVVAVRTEARLEVMREIVDVLRKAATIYRESATKLERFSPAQETMLECAHGMDGAIVVIDAWWASKEQS